MAPEIETSRRGVLRKGVLVGSILAGGVQRVAAQQAEEEPNDNRSNATRIEVEPNTETRVNGRVGPDLPLNSDPEDWLTFQAQQGDRITIDISGGAGPIELIDPNGTLLDTTGNVPSGDRLQATAQQDGAYFIHLTLMTIGANQEYSLTIQLARAPGPDDGNDDPDDDDEPDGNSTQYRIVLGGPQSGRVEYAFTVTGDAWPTRDPGSVTSGPVVTEEGDVIEDAGSEGTIVRGLLEGRYYDAYMYTGQIYQFDSTRCDDFDVWVNGSYQDPCRLNENY